MKTPAIACLAIVAVCAACSDHSASPTSPASATPAVTAASSAGSGNGKLSDKAVTTTVSDVDANGSPASITSDGHGSYTNGSNTVVSILTANGYNSIPWGDWQFDTTSSATRTVGHGFYTGDEIAVNPPLFTVPANPPYLGVQSFPSRLQVECTFVGKNMLAMSAGAMITCGMGSTWTASSTVSYGLSPNSGFTGIPPEATDIQIVCNGAAPDGCNDWTLKPDPAQSSIARLVKKQTTHGNSVTQTNEGDFFVRFLIHVTRP